MIYKINIMVIFKTTNLLNGRFYIGKDAKNNQKYFGSGLAIKAAIKKYGKENFKKEILCECHSLKELSQKECEYITNETLNDPLCYNIAPGGQGGDLSTFIKKFPSKGKTWEEIYGEEKARNMKKNMSEKTTGEKNGMYHSDKTQGIKNGMYGKKGESSPSFGLTRTQITKDKIAAHFLNRPFVERFGEEKAFKIKQKMSEKRRYRELDYYIEQINNEGIKIGEFKTIADAIEKLKLSSKKAYNNSYKEFKFIKVQK